MPADPLKPDPTLSLHRARQEFFRHAGFGPDGGYDAPWQQAAFGPLAYRVPNPPARAAALRLHDLHHLVTGYDTDWRGESEISAWELGSGGGGLQPYAWIIALWGLFVGLIALPGDTLRAFARGRRSLNLYGLRHPPALDGTVGELSERLRVGPAQPGAWAPGTPLATRVADTLALGAWGVAAVAWGLTGGTLVIGLVAAAGLGSLGRLLRCGHDCHGQATA